MKTLVTLKRIPKQACVAAILVVVSVSAALAERGESPQAGLAVRDITPPVPIRLAGYAGRIKAAEHLDGRLVVQALALKNKTGERCVLVALDNCEVSRDFLAPVLQQLEQRHQLRPGEVVVISSHTHSAPVLADTLVGMGQPPAPDQGAIRKYSEFLRSQLVEVVGAALSDCQPAVYEYGCGQAGFAMNRRVYRGDKVVFGDNPDGPVDKDVPVLCVKDAKNNLRALLFGYACHGTSVRTGEDWYTVSAEYMGYARQQLEALHPGVVAMYVTGMGADSDPFPRGPLVAAKRHGLELAGSVMGVIERPMRPVSGPFKLAYEEVPLPLADPPSREQLQADAQSKDANATIRAKHYLELMAAAQPLPKAINLPVGVLRLGDDLTFVFVAGEVVVDYSKRLKRLLAPDHPWTVGYAYEVPCYIPSARIIKEGGYEAESSLIYYGFYGPFQGAAEDRLIEAVARLVGKLRSTER